MKKMIFILVFIAINIVFLDITFWNSGDLYWWSSFMSFKPPLHKKEIKYVWKKENIKYVWKKENILKNKVENIYNNQKILNTTLKNDNNKNLKENNFQVFKYLSILNFILIVWFFSFYLYNNKKVKNKD